MFQSHILSKPSLASIGLQMSLFYGSLFSLMYGLIIGIISLNKVCESWLSLTTCYLTVIFLHHFHQVTLYVFDDSTQKYLLSLIMLVWIISEPTRIFYGYNGNLREKVC